MKVFVTGCSGLLGGALIPQLVQAGHIVAALSRSPSSDSKLSALGATPVRGDQTSLDILAVQALLADAVIHAAFGVDDKTDPTWYITACDQDRAAIKAMCDALVDRPGAVFIYTSGTLGSTGPGEESGKVHLPHVPRWKSEELTSSYADRLRVYTIRIPPINHGPDHRHAFVTDRITAAKRHGFAGYVDAGDQVWPSCHVNDAARIYVLALDSTCTVKSGSNFHAVAEHVTMREIAEYIGTKTGLAARSVPLQDAMEHWGFTGLVLAMNDESTSWKTREWLGWEPVGYGLFSELDGYEY
jgi:nucleoside-diphosphate-sugar epimerase